MRNRQAEAYLSSPGLERAMRQDLKACLAHLLSTGRSGSTAGTRYKWLRALYLDGHGSTSSFDLRLLRRAAGSMASAWPRAGNAGGITGVPQKGFSLCQRLGKQAARSGGVGRRGRSGMATAFAGEPDQVGRIGSGADSSKHAGSGRHRKGMSFDDQPDRMSGHPVA